MTRKEGGDGDDNRRQSDSDGDIFDKLSEIFNEMKDEMEKGMKEGMSDEIDLEGEVSENLPDPHVDVMENDETVILVADLPGYRKEDIQLKALENEAVLRASRKNEVYEKEIELPARIDVDSSQARYNNGVLEVIFEKA